MSTDFHKQYFKLKGGSGCVLYDLTRLRPEALRVLSYFVQYCNNEGLPAEITNITGKFAQSKSNVHPEGRGFDASTREWTARQVFKCIRYMTEKCGHLGAYSASDGKQRLVIHHDIGLGEHFHFQVARR